MTLAVYASVSCFSPSPRPVLVLSTGGSSLIGFRAPPLTCFSCLGLGLGAFLSFCGLLLLSSWLPLSSTGTSLVLFSVGGCCLPSCLSLRSLPSWASVSLTSISFGLVFCSGALLLSLCPSHCLFGFLECVLLGRYFLSSFGFGFLFVVVRLLRNSVESQFLRDGVLPLGRVHSAQSYFVPMSLVLFWFWSLVLFFFFCSWLGGLSPVVGSLLWVPLLLSLPGGFLPSHVGLAFFLFFLCCHLLPFRFVRSFVFICVVMCLGSGAVAVVLFSYFAFFYIVFLQLEESVW